MNATISLTTARGRTANRDEDHRRPGQSLYLLVVLTLALAVCRPLLAWRGGREIDQRPSIAIASRPWWRAISLGESLPWG